MKHPRLSAKPLDGSGRTLPQLLVERAASIPDTIAQRRKTKGIWQRLSWAELHSLVRGYAAGLAEKGVARGDAVAVIGENQVEFVAAELAIQSIGATCVPLYPDMTIDELRFVCEHSDVKAIVAQDQEQVDKVLSFADEFGALRVVAYWDDKGMWSYTHPLLLHVEELAKMGESRLADGQGEFEAWVAAGKPTETAVILYTSGTTSRPKGVVCSHAFLIDNALRLGRGADTRVGMDYLSYIPLAWALEQFLGVTLGLLQPLVLNFPERPESILADLREIGVETVFFGPRQWESLATSIRSHMFDAGRLRKGIYELGLKVGAATNLAKLEGRPAPLWARLVRPLAEAAVLKPLRDKLGFVRTHAALCAGAAMAPDAFRLFHTIGVPLRNAYGSTEFGLVSIHQGAAFDLETSGSIIPVDAAFGRQIDWKLSDDNEILVRGGTGFSTYLKQPDKTAERFDGEWFRTGDYGSKSPNGDVVVLDRLDDLRTLSNGATYPPQYIETRLRFSSFIKEAMTVGDATRGHVAALIEIDGEIISQWADERKIGFSTFADLSQRPEIRALIVEEISRVNGYCPSTRGCAASPTSPSRLTPTRVN